MRRVYVQLHILHGEAVRLRAEQEFLGGVRPNVNVTARHRTAYERDPLGRFTMVAHSHASVILALVRPGLLDGSARTKSD